MTPELVDTHVERLAASSFTLAFEMREVSAERTFEDRRVVATADLALLHDRIGTVDRFVELASDRTTWRAPVDGTYDYGDLRQCCIGRVRSLAHANEGHGPRFVWWAVNGGSWAPPARTTVGESTFFEISADGVADAEVLGSWFEADAVSSFAASGKVSTAGVVRDLESVVEFVRDGETRRVESAYDVSDVGLTTVEQPAWVETARERAPDISASLVDGDTYVRFEHGGGDPLPERTHVGIHRVEGHGDEAELGDGVDAGQTVYAALDGGGTILVRVGSPPDVADPLALAADRGWTVLQHPGSSANYYKSGLTDL